MGAALGPVDAGLLVAGASWVAARSVTSPELSYSATETNLRAVASLPHLTRSYWPFPPISSWCGPASGWASTLWAAARQPPPVATTMETLHLPDGGRVQLDWFRGECAVGSTDTLALLLPGLGNDSSTGFIRQAAAALAGAGVVPVTLNYRGVLGELSSGRLGCMDSWQDLDLVVARLIALGPRRVVGVGWSMGGVILARYLGQATPLSKHIAQAVTLSAPLDTSAQLKWMKQTLRGQGLDTVLGIGLLLKLLLQQQGVLNHLKEYGIGWRETLRIRRLTDADELIVCPMNGYSSVEDYYYRNNPAPLLHKIKLQMLVVHASDDPVVPAELIPRAEIASNSHIILARTQHGGHLGWTSKQGVGGVSWADGLMVNFFKAAHFDPTQLCVSKL